MAHARDWAAAGAFAALLPSSPEALQPRSKVTSAFDTSGMRDCEVGATPPEATISSTCASQPGHSSCSAVRTPSTTSTPSGQLLHVISSRTLVLPHGGAAGGAGGLDGAVGADGGCALQTSLQYLTHSELRPCW
jgi:hypothetical protein